MSWDEERLGGHIGRAFVSGWPRSNTVLISEASFQENELKNIKYTYRNQRDVWVTLVWCCRSPDIRGRLEISPTLPRLDSKKAPWASLWQVVINVTTMNSFSYRQNAHHRAGNTHRRPAKLLLRVCNNSYRLICIVVFWEGTFMGWKNVHTSSQFSWGPEMFKSLLTCCKIIIQRH